MDKNEESFSGLGRIKLKQYNEFIPNEFKIHKNTYVRNKRRYFSNSFKFNQYFVRYSLPFKSLMIYIFVCAFEKMNFSSNFDLKLLTFW